MILIFVTLAAFGTPPFVSLDQLRKIIGFLRVSNESVFQEVASRRSLDINSEMRTKKD